MRVCYGAMNWRNLTRVLQSTVETTGSVLIIVCAAALFGWVLARERVPQLAGEFIFNLMMGLLTPPVGLVLFVLSSVTEIPVARIIRGVVPVYLPLVMVLMLISFIPFFTTWLPGVLG